MRSPPHTPRLWEEGEVGHKGCARPPAQVPKLTRRRAAGRPCPRDRARKRPRPSLGARGGPRRPPPAPGDARGEAASHTWSSALSGPLPRPLRGIQDLQSPTGD